jgi:hypothetical protein
MNDTSPEAAEVQMRIFRAMPPARRLGIALSWSMGLRDMIKAKLRQDNPGASEAMLLRLLADRWLGPELATKVYGPHSAYG